MSNTADTPTWLTTDYMETILESYFEDDSIRVVSLKIGLASSVGDNYAGKLYRIEVEYNRKRKIETRSIIAKMILDTAVTQEFNKGYDMFKIETTMMTKTLPLLHKELRAKGVRERFFPYLYKLDTENKVILMEDLQSDGYVMVNRTASLDLDHVLLAVKALAQLHASSYLYLKKDPKHKDNYLDYFLKKRGENDIMEKIVDGSFGYLLQTLDSWQISEDDKKIIRNFKGKLYKMTNDSYELDESDFNVLLQDDCSIRNMMFSYKNGKVNSCKLIDFQTCTYNSIGIDINYLLFSSAKEYVKLHHLEDVFKAYYDSFVAVTGELQEFTLDTVRNQFFKRLTSGFIIAINFRPVILAEKPFDMDAYFEGRESESNLEMLQNKEFISEMSNLIPLFKEHVVFKS